MRVNLTNAISFRVVDEINVGHEGFIGNLTDENFFRYCSELECYFCKSRVIVDFGHSKRTIWFDNQSYRDKFVDGFLPKEITYAFITEL